MFAWAGFLLCLILLAGGNAAAQRTTYTRYFLDRPPTAEELKRFADIKEPITVVRVRIIWSIRLGNRHDDRKVDLRGARLSDLDKEGATLSEAVPQLDVLYSTRADRYLIFPRTPDHRCPEYFVAVVVGNDGKKRILPFPAMATEYELWEAELRVFTLRDNRPGYPTPRHAEREQGCWR